ncbi:MAG: ABC transporter permease [Oscillospiraceae bacterium]|nr:ABC transporter permease [Oscillospiraceae bacterium]
MTGKMSRISKAYMGLVFAFLYIPIFVLIFFSFNQSKSRNVFTGFTLDWYRQLFGNDMILKALLMTLIDAAVSSVLATLLGTAAAVGISSMKKWTRFAVMNVTYIPVVNPEIVTGVSMLLLFVGMRALWSGFQMGLVTLIIAHITFNVPYVILSVCPKLRQMDKNLYEAALDLGCNKYQAFFKVVIPEIMPGIATGFLMALTYSIDDFVISYFTSGTVQTLPIAVYSMTRRKVSPEINALSTLLFVAILTILMIKNYVDIKGENRIAKESRL